MNYSFKRTVLVLLKGNSCRMREPLPTFKRRGYIKLPKKLDDFCGVTVKRSDPEVNHRVLDRDREDNSRGHLCRDVPVPGSVKSLMSFFLQMPSTHFKYSFFSHAFLCVFICERYTAEEKETCFKQDSNAGWWCVSVYYSRQDLFSVSFALILLTSVGIQHCELLNRTLHSQLAFVSY